MSQNDTQDQPEVRTIDITPKHAGLAYEFIGLYPLRDKSGKFEEGMFAHYKQCASIADKYNELVPEHNELEAEAERRRQAITHLLEWKTVALQSMTDEQVTFIHDRIVERSEQIRPHTHYTDSQMSDGTCVYTELNGMRCGEQGPWPSEVEVQGG